MGNSCASCENENNNETEESKIKLKNGGLKKANLAKTPRVPEGPDNFNISSLENENFDSNKSLNEEVRKLITT